VGDASTAQQPPAPRGAVALVADQVVGPLAGPAPPTGTGHRDRVKDRFELGAVVPLTRGADHAQRPAAAVAAQVDLGGQPAPGPAERLDRVVRDPLLRSLRVARLRAPAACWWAGTLLESTHTTHSSSPTASDLVWVWASSRSQGRPFASGRSGQSRWSRAVALGEVPPGRTGPQLPEDGVDHGAVVTPAAAATLVAGQQRCQLRPGLVGELSAADHRWLPPPAQRVQDRRKLPNPIGPDTP
jgi:hypothetical protein